MSTRRLRSDDAWRTGAFVLVTLLAATACEVLPADDEKPPARDVGPTDDAVGPDDLASALDGIAATDATRDADVPGASDAVDAVPDLPPSQCRHPDAESSGYLPWMLTVNTREQLLQLEGCTGIIELYIENAVDVTDLLPLESLTRVEKGLRIIGNPNLVDLMGLRNVSEIGGGLFVWKNAALETVKLDALLSVGLAEDYDPNLRVEENPALKVVSFPVLEVTGASLTIATDATTGPLGPWIQLPRLTSVGGAARLDDGGDLELPLLESVGRDFDLSGVYVFATLSLPKLRSVGGTLTLPKASELYDQEVVLPALAHLGSGWFSGQKTLELPALDTVDADLIIQDLYQTSLDLTALVEVGKDLAIEANTNLDSLTLPLLSTVREDLYIRANPKLPQEDVDEILARVNVGGNTVVSGNLE